MLVHQCSPLPCTHPYTDKTQRIPSGPTGLQRGLTSHRNSTALVLLGQQTRLLAPQRRTRLEASVNWFASTGLSRHFWQPFLSRGGSRNLISPSCIAESLTSLSHLIRKECPHDPATFPVQSAEPFISLLLLGHLVVHSLAGCSRVVVTARGGASYLSNEWELFEYVLPCRD